ncbi:MAG: SH3 domain-containing protein [Candidatus Peribacteraceae bacterium]|nr:SH3 domain-containing protein [Candidatus Peribacteraceae bacterium]
MARYRVRRRSGITSVRPLVFFLIIASFGILFAGCGPKRTVEEVQQDDFTFTADDVARYKELARQAEGGIDGSGATLSGQTLLRLVGVEQGSSSSQTVLDLMTAQEYQAIRSGPAAMGEDLYRVTNEFVNVRDSARITAGTTGRLVRGDVCTVLDFVDAAWAHVKLSGGREGFVAQRYIAKLTSEAKLAEEKAKYKDQYFVDFGFLNVRKAPDSGAEKLGELPGQAIVRVLNKDDVWARIPFQGKEGYAAVQYLKPFLPNFLVRQEDFTLPILHYNVSQEGILDALTKHVAALRNDGIKLITLRDFRTLLLEQEKRDVRLEPKTVAIAFSGITPLNVKGLSDTLTQLNLRATLFFETKQIGITGITEKTLLTLIANGQDLQSAAHSGDDLRSLTNAQLALEFAQSRQLIEQYTKEPVFAVAYPFGGVNSRVEAQALSAGYLLGVSAAQQRTFKRADLLKLPSFAIGASVSTEDVLGLVKGQ